MKVINAHSEDEQNVTCEHCGRSIMHIITVEVNGVVQTVGRGCVKSMFKNHKQILAVAKEISTIKSSIEEWSAYNTPAAQAKLQVLNFKLSAFQKEIEG